MAKNSGIMKKYAPSEELAQLTGDKLLTRADATKAIWAYYNENGKKVDATLKAIVGSVSKLTPPLVAKKLSGHLFSDDEN